MDQLFSLLLANEPGKGTMYFKNGEKYQGEWSEDRRHGRGMQWRISRGEYQLAYTGEWRRGNKHGKGVYYDKVSMNTHTYLYIHNIFMYVHPKNSEH